VGAAPLGRDRRRGRRARLRGQRRSAATRSSPHRQAFQRDARRGSPDGRRSGAHRSRRAARDGSLVQVRRGQLPADPVRRGARRALAGRERRPAVPHGARFPRVTTPLEVQGLGFQLPGRGTVYEGSGLLLVWDVSFTVGVGETLVLLGRSGSGKSTTLKLINRLLEPTTGEVRVAGAR